jgi:hypothetical protein
VSLVSPKAYAPPLTGIVIDGELDDWPIDAKYYLIRTKEQLNPGDLGADFLSLDASEDLDPRFSAGYDSTENLIYVAVQVIDNALSVGGYGRQQNDACEILVAGDPNMVPEDPGGLLGLSSLFFPTPADRACLWYAVIPGEGTYGRWHKGNPSLGFGQIHDTRTKAAFKRQGNTTIYEWAIEAFDRFPDRPTVLVSGKTIRFDVIIADNDGGGDTSSIVFWGPPFKPKFSRTSSHLGDLILVSDAKEKM